MTRLIDGDALIELINGGYDLDFDEVPETKRELLRMITEQPTVDAVPVIRCKDCRFSGADATCCLVCKREGMGLKPFHVYHDDFCSYAERKEE